MKRVSKTKTILSRFEKYLRKRITQRVTNRSKLYREIEEKGYKGHYISVCRFANELKAGLKKTKRSIRFETGPGEQAQVDWGSFGKILMDGKHEPLYAFVCILGYSRMKYVEFTIRQNLRTLLNCHIHAFERLGVSKEILYDNMKTVVLKRDRKHNLEPNYNPKFQEFAKYYGFNILLSHPYWPRDKGKVEAAIKLLRNDFMNGMKFGRDFFSIEDLNKKVTYWLDTKANRQIHTTTGERPFIRFEKEKNHLRFPNPRRHYETSLSSARYVTGYGMVRYKYNSYSVPDGFERKKVIVNERSENGVVMLDIYCKNKLIAIHKLASGRNKWVQDEKHFKTSINAFKTKKRMRKENEKLLHTDFSRPLTYYDRFLKDELI